MMALSGMKITLTKNPMNPMTRKPKAVLCEIMRNSRLSGLAHLFMKRELSFPNFSMGSTTVLYTSIAASSAPLLRFSAVGVFP
eukprot:CAMPEP_0170140576 /NCGR_PEP_ID=MMETSP0033_2-20121228/6443_1 /TAXON_ID=195969 /ORGANISM="Dolichomastix tenuilepis, Strain CCMP3274" /LENGTH=82 /DNA_ID=CAMNT_0010376789 /DNA_START=90 /DNA_END=338 /DNA_ORIENTATION=+